MQVFLLVKFTANDQQRDQLIDALRENIAFVRAHEPGFVRCDLIEEVGDADSAQCVMLEVYESEAAYEVHRTAPYGADLYAKVKPFMSGMPTVTRFSELP